VQGLVVDVGGGIGIGIGIDVLHLAFSAKELQRPTAKAEAKATRMR
jgi:hypothetical protein